MTMAKKKTGNIFSKAAAYRKDHPRTSFQDAIKKVSGKKVGAVKKKVSVTGHTKPKKKTVIKTERLTTIGRVAPRRSAVSTAMPAAYRSGMAILKNIDKMEAELKKTKGVDAKNLLKTLINKQHDKLDHLKKQA